jgi:hypothetical protein
LASQIFRKLIEVEIRLGFLSIPSKGVELMPSKNEKIKVNVNGKDILLSYNPEHRRIFGLTSWYRKQNAKPGDLVILTKKNDLYLIVLKNQEISGPKEEQEEAEKLVDLSGLSTQAKGDIVEERIKELLLLHGQGLLSAYRPVTDTEGIDLIVVKNGQFHPIFLQIKGRYNLHQDRSLIISVKTKTFSPHSNFFVVGAFFNPKTLEIDENILLIPSKELVKNAITVNSKKNGEWYRIVSSINNEYTGKWSKFVIKKKELSSKLFEKFHEIEEHLK